MSAPRPGNIGDGGAKLSACSPAIPELSNRAQREDAQRHVSSRFVTRDEEPDRRLFEQDQSLAEESHPMASNKLPRVRKILDIRLELSFHKIFLSSSRWGPPALCFAAVDFTQTHHPSGNGCAVRASMRERPHILAECSPESSCEHIGKGKADESMSNKYSRIRPLLQ